nr:class I SAM-dependent methyltransferase [Propionibacterium sp.]
MDLQTAEWLVSADAGRALALAAAQPDPESLAAATRLRAAHPPERAAAALDQVVLRARARRKFGDAADAYFWTAAGLEQATRPAVSTRRAARFAASGAVELVDLGCGLGLDAAAAAAAGLAVTAVERDPVTAVLAAANLARVPGARVRVLTGDAEALAPELLAGGAAVFCDPARRTAAGRSWRIEDLSPPWPFVRTLLDGSRPACVKLGPGLPLGLIPDEVEAEWLSDAGDVVEAALWAGPGTTPGRRRAVVDGAELVRDAALPAPPVGPVGAHLYEPDGAVIRAGLVPAVAEQVGGWRVHEGVAYLTASGLVPTPWAEAFEVLEVLPHQEKALRAWVRERGVGILEIKKRGVDADPAALRRRLRPAGPHAATLVLTPTASGAVALVVRRCRP